MRQFIETHFGLVLIFACVLGLILPGLPRVPNESSIVALAALMFVSSYKLRDGGFESIRWGDVALFWFMRYALLPLLLWFVAHQFIPAYAASVLLLSVVPAAVSSPAFSSIYGGAVPPAFAIVVLSQLLTPVLIPVQFLIVGGEHVSPSPAHLFLTLLWCIVLPMAAYFLARNHQKTADYIYTQNKFFSILLIVFVIALAVAKQRDVILDNPIGVVPPLMVALACYSVYMIAAWVLSAKRSRPERVTYATCSAFNNAALAVSLGLMHFPPDVVLFVAASEIGWAFLPAIFKRFLLFFPR